GMYRIVVLGLIGYVMVQALLPSIAPILKIGVYTSLVATTSPSQVFVASRGMLTVTVSICPDASTVVSMQTLSVVAPLTRRSSSVHVVNRPQTARFFALPTSRALY